MRWTTIATSVILATMMPSADARGITATGRAHDADTIGIDIRVHGVDSFERRQQCQTTAGRCFPCGEGARAFTRRLLGQTKNERGRSRLFVEFNGDETYGRPVASILVDGRDLGEQLIRQGWAIPSRRHLESDPARRRAYEAAFQAASRERRGGLQGQWLDPSAWRRGQRLACELRAKDTRRPRD